MVLGEVLGEQLPGHLLRILGEAWLPSPEYDASVTLPSVSSDASQDVVSVSEEPPPSPDATAAPAVSLVIFGGLANVRPAGILA